MNHEGRVLIVDDDDAFLRMYQDILEEDGYIAEIARDRRSALAHLDRGGWSMVILDQKLQGPEGPDSGLDLIDEASVRAPGARVILISGYATTESVERAFERGAHDFLEKTATLPALLRIKLRGAQAIHRAQQASRVTRDDLRRLWSEARAAADPGRRGKLFEDFVAELFRNIDGLGRIADLRRRNEIEEIDAIIVNEATLPPWSREESYFLVECKHWRAPVDRRELDAFVRKIERRQGRCSVGLFIAPGGFSRAFIEALRRDAHRAPFVIALDQGAIDRLIDADDRLTVLSALHLEATMDPGSA